MTTKTSFFGILAVVFSLSFQGCVLAPPVMVQHYESHLSFKETVLMLSSQARKCWTAPVDPMRPGIHIASKIALDDSVVISAHSIGWDSGVNPKYFLIIHVKRDVNNAIVEISEGDYDCDIFSGGCKKLDLAPHVGKWLSGDLQCFGGGRKGSVIWGR